MPSSIALLFSPTYPGWFTAALTLLLMAWGTFVFLNPVVFIELLHRGEENSPITRRYLDWNPWLSEPIFIRVLGAGIVSMGVWFFVDVVLR